MFRILIALLAAIPALPVSAQTPEMASEIQWEITNRFAPFEAFENPDALFATWALANERESVNGWHARRWVESGHRLASPYADALRVDAPTHWNPGEQAHRDTVLRFIKQERAPQTKVRAQVWMDHPGACHWTIGSRAVFTASCTTPVDAQIPLIGQPITVRLSDGTTLTQRLTPTHKVILGLGDSYGSGQGNPDLPARWKNRLTLGHGNVAWMTRSRNLAPGGAARWLDERCDRSFFSYQSLTALGIAARDPHVFVSFLHHACTGAETFDGVLTPQLAPGGSAGYNRRSQLNAAIDELCLAPTNRPRAIATEATGGVDLLKLRRRNRSWLQPQDPSDRGDLRAQRTATGLDAPRSGIAVCPPGRLRAPDMVLLSVGGNDVGFAQLVQYFVAPVIHTSWLVTDLVLPDLCPAPGFRVDPLLAPHAARYCSGQDRRLKHTVADLIGTANDGRGISGKLRLIFSTFEHYLRIPRARIVMVQYPDPLRLSEAAPDPCAPVSQPVHVKGDPPGLNPTGPWAGLKTVAPEETLRNWRFNLRADEARLLLLQFDRLREQLAQTARAEGITFACAGRDAFLGHGWWQGHHLTLPNSLNAPWPPATWRPYRWERQGRAVRTGNDSALTQANGALAITGAVHPNLTGHALLADVVLHRLGLGAEPPAPRVSHRAGPF